MRRRQRWIATSVALVGVPVVVVVGLALFDEYCRVRYAENLILRQAPRPESAWHMLTAGDGHVLRVARGRFKGWYLAADELVEPREPPEVLRGGTIPIFRMSARPSGPYARCVVLRERLEPDCVWKVSESEGRTRLQAAHGRYAGWFLDSLQGYTPDTGVDPPSAWNLILVAEPQAGAVWTFTRTDGGVTIQSAGGAFASWYLDSLTEAKVVEENRCREKPKPRAGPSPPLAD